MPVLRSSTRSSRRTDILVSLLPATPETDGIINRETIRKLSRKGPFGAPVIINAGRGRQQVAEDILAALDAGELHGATLDVFVPEPLPPDSRFWTHPKVTVTPHTARRLRSRSHLRLCRPPDRPASLGAGVRESGGYLAGVLRAVMELKEA